MRHLKQLRRIVRGREGFFARGTTLLALGFTISLVGARTARADCTPAAANGVTAICTGVTTNQGSGAPGTSFGTNGYGTGTETDVTLTVAAGATLQGTFAGFSLQSGTLINSGFVYGTSPIFGGGGGAWGTLTVINNQGAGISGPIGGLGAQTLISPMLETLAG
jgi:hypothetical protein